MWATATQRGPRRPPHLGVVLLASFCLTVVSFFAASWFSDARSQGILRDARTIIDISIPAMNELADARTELRHIEETVDELVEPRADAARIDAALQDARERLRSRWTVYKALPPFPEERARWPEVERDLAALDESIEELMRDLRAHDNGGARMIQRGALDPAIERVDTELRQLIRLNAESAIAMAENVTALRLESRRWILVLDAVSALFAGVAAFAAIRLVRQYARVMERRVDELEQFAGRVAHDIRSPLNAVGLALAVAEKRPGIDERMRANLARGHRALARVGLLVDDLLMFARSGAAPQEEGHADLEPAIDGVIEDLTPAAKEKDIELRVEPVAPSELACSAGVLTSLVSNLVTNAIKHMGAATVRRVTVRARDLGTKVRVEVQDTGPGIPPRRQGIVFDPYIRGPDASAPGLGLGLATVRRLAQAHGGAAGLESQEGRGSVFWFELPKAPKTTPDGDGSFG